MVAMTRKDAVDLAPLVTAVLVILGALAISVTNGQIIEFDDEDTSIEKENGILGIEATALTLQVIAIDTSGNSAVAEVQPTGLSANNDYEGGVDDD